MSTAPAPTRPPAVAGTFYPTDPAELARVVDFELAAGTARTSSEAPVPKALIVPHAGYVYSGSVAASGYARLMPAGDKIRRVVLLGPAHRVAVPSMAVPTVDAFLTPLGAVPVDDAARRAVAGMPGVAFDDRPHAPEHSLEVHLPFLQRALGPCRRPDGTGWSVLPIIVGDAGADQVAAVIDRLWGGDETVVVVSTDLSHHHDHDTAQRLDAATVAAMAANRLEAIGPGDACGAHPVRGLLMACRRRGLHADILDVRTSADTAGDHRRVVGYAALAVVDGPITRSVAEDVTTCDAATGTAAGADRADADADADAVDTTGLTAVDRRVLLATARRALADHLGGDPTPVDMDGASPALHRPGASFVTLRHAGGELRGCIGTMAPNGPLVTDVAANAVKAATMDPRFVAVRPEELAALEVHVSVLTDLEPMTVGSRQDLVDRITTGVDGLLIEAGRHRATFLPSVWDQLPNPDDYLDHLWAKAGLRPRTWPHDLRAWRYQAVDIG